MVSHVANDLQVALRLHEAAHNAIAQIHLAVSSGHRRNYGVERTFARLQRVGVLRF